MSFLNYCIAVDQVCSAPTYIHTYIFIYIYIIYITVFCNCFMWGCMQKRCFVSLHYSILSSLMLCYSHIFWLHTYNNGIILMCSGPLVLATRRTTTIPLFPPNHPKPQHFIRTIHSRFGFLCFKLTFLVCRGGRRIDLFFIIKKRNVYFVTLFIRKP